MSIRPQLKHLGIYVTDLERMERFYTSVFGLIVSDRAPASGPSVVFQISFHMQALDELREIRSRLVRAGVEQISPIDHGNAWSIYASDPEGNGLEAYVDSPWHVAQPHGRPFDLSLPDERIFADTESVVRQDPTFAERNVWIGGMTRLLS